MGDQFKRLVLSIVSVASAGLFLYESYNIVNFLTPNEELPLLEGTRWEEHVDGVAFLGYEFLDSGRVNLLSGGDVFGTVPYHIEKNKIVVKHSCGTDVLALRSGQIQWINHFPPPVPFDRVR